MEDDINTVHRYRDSIVAAHDGPYEHTSFGAYVLFPFGDEDTNVDHHFYTGINEVNIGALPFLPNVTRLVEQFVERLINSSPEELQEDGIFPIGSIEQWMSDLDVKVFVGLVSSKEDYSAFIQGGYYGRLSSFEKGWQEAKFVGLYCKNGVADVHGVQEYGEITDVTFLKVGGMSSMYNFNTWTADR